MFTSKRMSSMLRLLNKSESRVHPSLFLCGPNVTCVRFNSHYTTLGLDSSASPKEIKSAYYDLSFKFHPDKNDGSPESIRKFREIAEAYEVLGNPEKKRAYDQDRSHHPYDSPYNNHEWRPHDFRYKTRSSFYEQRSPPRTGRTKYYDYDEHYKRHYQDDDDREKEYQNFRRAWEADLRRRYGNGYRFDFRDRNDPNVRHVYISRYFLHFFGLSVLMCIIAAIGDRRSDMPVDKSGNSSVRYYDPVDTTYGKVYYKIKEDPTPTDE